MDTTSDHTVRFSIIVPAYNNCDSLARCLSALHAEVPPDSRRNNSACAEFDRPARRSDPVTTTRRPDNRTLPATETETRTATATPRRTP